MAALVVALLSFAIPVVGGGAAVVLGIVALVRIARSAGSRIGRAMAWSSIALGVVTAAGWAAMIGSGTIGFRAEGFVRGMGEMMDDELSSTQISSMVDIGDCLALDMDNLSPIMVVTPGHVVDCDDHHTAEYVGSIEAAGGPESDWPGYEELYDRYVLDCVDLFEEAIGQAYDTATLDVFVLYPGEGSWNLGDREVACFVVDVEHQPLTEHVIGN